MQSPLAYLMPGSTKILDSSKLNAPVLQQKYSKQGRLSATGHGKARGSKNAAKPVTRFQMSEAAQRHGPLSKKSTASLSAFNNQNVKSAKTSARTTKQARSNAYKSANQQPQAGNDPAAYGFYGHESNGDLKAKPKYSQGGIYTQLPSAAASSACHSYTQHTQRSSTLRNSAKSSGFMKPGDKGNSRNSATGKSCGTGSTRGETRRTSRTAHTAGA